MSAPLGGVTMGDRCLSALKALGGQATTGQVRAQVEAEWRRPLTTAQVAVALACLSREHPPRVTRHPAAEGGHAWRAVFTVADAGVLAGELTVFEAAVTTAVREAPC